MMKYSKPDITPNEINERLLQEVINSRKIDEIPKKLKRIWDRRKGGIWAVKKFPELGIIGRKRNANHEK